MLARLANQFWIRSSYSSYIRFLRGCRNPQKAQQKVLSSILQKNSSSEYGRRHQFYAIKDYPDFAQALPVIDYSDINTEIQRCASGESGVLVSEQISRFEETSGSNSHARLIPYTASLSQEFDRAIATWIYSLWNEHPEAMTGRSYWSLSPATKEVRTTVGGIPIGSSDDTEYFAFFTRWLLKHVMAIHPGLAKIRNPDEFYMKTLQQLLCREDLSLISIWSPTFFIRLDERLRHLFPELIESVRPKITAKRYNFLRGITAEATWKMIWPQLSLCSCWSHASSAGFLPRLKERLGDVDIQGKGLISTEGIVSVPIRSDLDPVAAITSHFLEGRDTQTADIVPLQAWKINRQYEVILTTGGGLYRYSTGDIVQVSGFFHGTPCLKFMGRGNRFSDMVGEKLSEYQVVEMIQRLRRTMHLENLKVLIYADSHAGTAFYCALVDGENIWSETIPSMEYLMDSEIRKNPYYDQARNLGQLGAIKVRLLNPGQYEAIMRQIQLGKGISDGDFKNPVLLSSSAWPYKELKQYLTSGN